MGVNVISEKVSFRNTAEFLNIIILGKIERWKESLLVAWCVAWVFCGGVVITEVLGSTDRDARMMFIVFMAFWAYFLFVVLRITLYRRGGNELIRVEPEFVILKRSFFTFGKSKTFHLENIKSFQKIELPERSLSSIFENTWWVFGGQKLGFEYQGKFVKFAMQISKKDQELLFNLINKKIKGFQKRK